MKKSDRPDTRREGGGTAASANRRAMHADRDVRFYAEAVYAINRGLPHIVDFPGRLS
jgi:hypothetical protein